MLKNNEIELLENILIGLDNEQQALELKQIIEKSKAAHRRCSESANKWNKAHAEKHCEHNKKYSKNKNSYFNIIMVKGEQTMLLIDKKDKHTDWQLLDKHNKNQGKVYTEKRARQMLNTLNKAKENTKDNTDYYRYDLIEIA